MATAIQHIQFTDGESSAVRDQKLRRLSENVQQIAQQLNTTNSTVSTVTGASTTQPYLVWAAASGLTKSKILSVLAPITISGGNTIGFDAAQVLLEQLGDVIVESPVAGQVLTYTTGGWVNGSTGSFIISWSQITGTPTTLAGYGITNAVPNTVQIIAGPGLSGGGALTGNVTLSAAPVVLFDEGPFDEPVYVGGPGGGTGTGAPGPTGAQGPAGPGLFVMADDGIDGDDGRPGTIGQNGATGAQGPAGPGLFILAEDGQDGDDGRPGQNGANGATGAQGPQGIALYIMAEDGPEGDQGNPGAAGAPGATGATGAQGPAGPALAMMADDGQDGDDGRPGATGATGSTGAQGPQGPGLFIMADDGQDGDDGRPGVTGATGAQGPQGTTGSTGAQGPAGPAIALMADDGQDGDDGMPGANGATGAQGIQGNTGPTGPQGPVAQIIYADDGYVDDQIIPFPGNGESNIYAGVWTFRGASQPITSQVTSGNYGIQITNSANTQNPGILITNSSASRTLEILYCDSSSAGLYGAAAKTAVINASSTATNGLLISTSDVGRFGIAASPAATTGILITGYGTTAGGMVDMTPDGSSFTGTMTGYGTNPTVTCVWAKMGHLVTMTVPAWTGTSNATTMTMTGMPQIIWPARTQFLSLPDSFFANSGTTASTVACEISTAGVITFYLTGSSTGWTASGTKAGSGFTITWQLN